MRGLKITIIFKIVVTIFLWVIPSLFFPQRLSNSFGFPPLEPLFIKLLGAAFAALCLGYILGLREIKNGRYPEISVWVGILSNGGAALILAFYGFSGHWNTWKPFAQNFMWFSLIAVSAVTFGLCYFGAYPHYFKSRSSESENP